MNMTHFILEANEDCKRYMARIMTNTNWEDWEPMGCTLLEIIVNDLNGQEFNVSTDLASDEIKMTITHNGKALRDITIKLIDDYVDYLHYTHENRNCHLLTMRKFLNSTK